jgi:diguanylate cyclase (GGDEF)-like protein
LSKARQSLRGVPGWLDATPEGWRIFGRIRIGAGLGAFALGAASLRYGRPPWNWGILATSSLMALGAMWMMFGAGGALARKRLEFAGAFVAVVLSLCITQATGGVTGPFTFVFLVPVFAYGISIGNRMAYRIAAICSLVIASLIGLETRGLAAAPPGELLAPVSVLLLLWIQAYAVEALAGHESARRAELVRLAEVDPLTGLMNRRTLQRALEHSAAHGEEFALILLDLDGFKAVNDEFGHLRGDEVLRAVAQATLGALRRDDMVIRYGGDEFAVVVKGGAEDARRVEERLHGAFAQLGQEMDVSLGFSAGVAVWPEDGVTLAKLLQVADGRLYQNKPAARAAAASSQRAASRRAATAKTVSPDVAASSDAASSDVVPK